MNNFEIEIKKIVSNQLNINIENIKLDSLFINDLGADSLDIIELIMSIEDKFNIELPNEKIEKIVSIKQVIFYIKKYIKN